MALNSNELPVVFSLDLIKIHQAKSVLNLPEVSPGVFATFSGFSSFENTPEAVVGNANGIADTLIGLQKWCSYPLQSLSWGRKIPCEERIKVCGQINENSTLTESPDGVIMCIRR